MLILGSVIRGIISPDRGRCGLIGEGGTAKRDERNGFVGASERLSDDDLGMSALCLFLLTWLRF
jgi:hypothetical protein